MCIYIIQTIDNICRYQSNCEKHFFSVHVGYIGMLGTSKSGMKVPLVGGQLAHHAQNIRLVITDDSTSVDPVNSL